ncbi:hypothetical protein ACJX0J_030433, partial [Zea mays]
MIPAKFLRSKGGLNNISPNYFIFVIIDKLYMRWLALIEFRIWGEDARQLGDRINGQYEQQYDSGQWIVRCDSHSAFDGDLVKKILGTHVSRFLVGYIAPTLAQMNCSIFFFDIKTSGTQNHIY